VNPIEEAKSVSPVGLPVPMAAPDAAPRRATFERATRETDFRVELDLDGSGRSRVATGVPFLDHMLAAFAQHARFDLVVEGRGDLEIDDHHTVEDVALALGETLARALGEKRSIRRFGCGYAPLDEALARAVVDLSGRPFARVRLRLVRERLGTLACENAGHFFRSLATAARMTLHLDLLRGSNDHHKLEAAFKALALALREAVARDEGDRCIGGVPSTKGTPT
jgi:imidazoleglycerol phosphate dehydratase HisB